MFSNRTQSNTLAAKCIKQYCASFSNNDNRSNANVCISIKLPINIRQSLFDYLIRERLAAPVELICTLLTGGLYSFDLWSLCDINPISAAGVTQILTTLADNCTTLNELSIGGATWIYNQKVISGPLRKLWKKTNLSKLTVLKLQQVSSSEELVSILECCDNLKKLDICQPSITDRDIFRIANKIEKCVQIRNSLCEISLPSSLKGSAIHKLLSFFPNIRRLKCAHFETLFDIIDIQESLHSGALITLSSLRGLTITHPMSCDAVNRIVSLCPLLEEVSLDVQDGMELSPLNRLRNLKRLEFRNSTTPTFAASYNHQILPLLQQKGASLEALSLEHFDNIDLSQCDQLCPNLEFFSLQWFTMLSYQANINVRRMKNPFSKVRRLRLRPRTQRILPSDVCLYFLSSAKQLSYIELYCCYELSDEDVKKIHAANPMTELKSLILRHGHNVTKETLNLLVSKASDLAFVDCGYPPTKKTHSNYNDEILEPAN